MTINYKFPSSEKKEIDFTPGFTAQERKYLSRAKKTEKRKGKLIDTFLLILLLASILFLGLTFERVILDPWLAANEAEAKEMTEADYCLLIKEGTKVQGATEEEITSHCARFGVVI